MNISICSYSFHRLLAAGKQDIFQYIQTCKALGCTQLDPWNAHLGPVRSRIESGEEFSADDRKYLDRVKQEAKIAGLPFGCMATDGAHIYDADPQQRRTLRTRAYRWLGVAAQLGIEQLRIDAGGGEDMTESFPVIKDGYFDLIERGKAVGVEILVENHWGPTPIVENVLKLLDEIPGLGFLWDSYNWKPEERAKGRRLLASRARLTHLKTLAFDADGNETTASEDVDGALQCLVDAKYQGCWGVESVPTDGDEIAGATKTIALIKRRTRVV